MRTCRGYDMDTDVARTDVTRRVYAGYESEYRPVRTAKGGRRMLMCLAALILCMLFLIPCGTACAAELIDTSAPTSLSLTYEHDGTVLPKVPVRIYKVATVDEACEYTLTGDFSSYPVALDTSFTASQWDSAADTLAGYVTADGIKALTSSSTDDSGTAGFTPLSTGLYLVVADETKVGDETYAFSPFLISLPDLDSDDHWIYDVSSAPKSSQNIPIVADVGYKVIKHWADSGYEQSRPTSITVELLKGGVSQGTQTLNADNGWSYTWDAPNDGSVWTVVERDVPDGYTVVMTTDSSSGTTVFTATNTYTPPTTPTTPTTPSTPTTTTPSTPTTTAAVKLPKTGDSTMLMPIIILAFIGVVMLLVGWRTKRDHDAAGDLSQANPPTRDESRKRRG